MPLDSSGVTPIFGRTADGEPVTARERPTLDYGPDIGVALRNAREHRGMSIQDVADETRIRRAYIAAIEDMRLDQLPSRPFTIGYVRSYAELMGFEPGAAIARFKESSPDPDGALREPVGVPQERDPRLGMIGVAGAVMLAAIITWNVAQRAINDDAPPPQTAPDIQVMAPTGPTGPVALGTPLPAPTESTTPELYLTPGLEAEPTGVNPVLPVVDPAAIQQASLATPATFTPKGTIHGAAPDASVVTLQARRPASLIVRGADGTVYFAKQMAGGEAYRAPMLKGLTLDVSDPTAFDVFVFGNGRGVLPAPQTPVANLAARAAG
ncbi:MAG TPA: helix-turn-helix domain-containing protein [Caulobacteraceae bacterium]|nr:helix-turn-helix domain-containing protein [Caulobacteraceae bacterium]